MSNSQCLTECKRPAGMDGPGGDGEAPSPGDDGDGASPGPASARKPLNLDKLKPTAATAKLARSHQKVLCTECKEELRFDSLVGHYKARHKGTPVVCGQTAAAASTNSIKTFFGKRKEPDSPHGVCSTYVSRSFICCETILYPFSAVRPSPAECFPPGRGPRRCQHSLRPRKVARCLY